MVFFKQIGILILCLFISQLTMYYFLDDIIVYFTDNSMVYILGRLVLGISLWALTNIVLKYKKTKFEIKTNKKYIFLFLIVYFVFLVLILFFKGSTYNRQFNFIPFSFIMDFQKVNSLILFGNILVNFLMFVPFGIVSLFFKTKSNFNNIQFFLYCSLFIEVIQFIFKKGIFDINDIILNTLGGLLGVYLTRKILLKNKKLINENNNM